MNISKHEASWHGQKAWVLENDTIRAVVVPDVGAKIVSLVDKRTGLEWLVGVGKRPFSPIPYAAPFTEQDMSGWDEMFPTINACDYPAPGKFTGVPLPDHGEVWAMPWTMEPSHPDALRMSVKGQALPYHLTRTLEFSNANTLLMHYQLENMSKEPLPFMWAAHPQFVCPNGADVILPAEVNEVCNVLPPEWGWGELERPLSWPKATRSSGKHIHINRTGPASNKQARKFFVPPEKRINWVGLIRHATNDWLRLDWDATQVPYFGVWMDEGFFSHESVVALEPITGFYDNLETAWEKQRITTIDAGKTKTWVLKVCLGTNEQTFPKA